VLRFVNESDRKSILKSGTVLPGMLGRQIWDVNYMESTQVATTAAAVRASTAKVVLIDVPHFSMCEFIHDTILAEGKYVEDIRFLKESGVQAFRSPADAGQVYEISTEVQIRRDLYDRLAESTCDKLRFGHWGNDSWAAMAGNVYEVLYLHSFKALQRDMGLANWNLLSAAPVNALLGSVCTMQCLVSNQEAEAVYAKAPVVPPVIVSIDISWAHAAILGNREAADDWNLFSQFSNYKDWTWTTDAKVQAGEYYVSHAWTFGDMGCIPEGLRPKELVVFAISKGLLDWSDITRRLLADQTLVWTHFKAFVDEVYTNDAV
jgi:hypothetical protein